MPEGLQTLPMQTIAFMPKPETRPEQPPEPLQTKLTDHTSPVPSQTAQQRLGDVDAAKR